MRNLRTIRHRQWQSDTDLTAVCWDAARDQILVTRGPTETVPRIELLRVSEADKHNSEIKLESVAAWDALSPNPDLAVDRIVDLHHFAGSLTTCVVLAGGDIVIVREQAPDAHIEIVGSIDAGITAARWAPDEEVLVLTTTQDTAVLMSRSFDGIAEANMSADDLKLSKHVSVGWGKKETQFQGKGAKAKALRDPTIPEKVDEGLLSSSDDQRTTISWRGDGAYVAINAVQPSLRRVIRVYTREGILDSVTEPVDGLEGSLSWRPAGNLMAGIQRLADRIDVVFFERNGLRHGQFTLRNPGYAKDALDDIGLEWNADSTVLAVSLGDRIQLWTMGNYHWYLKQEIRCGDRRPIVSWHPEKALLIAAVTADKLVEREHDFAIARGPTVPPHDRGLVAVIDGQIAKITPFGQANVPPPMALYEVEVESSIVDVSFSSDSSLMAVLHAAGVDVYSFAKENNRLLRPTLSHKMSFDPGTMHDGNVPLHVGCKSGKSVQVFTGSGTPTIWTGSLEPDGACSLTPVLRSATGLVTSHGFQHVEGEIILFLGGSLLPVESSTANELQWEDSISSESLLSAEVTGLDTRWLSVGLTRNGHLFAGGRQLAKNCTSFLLTSDHLIYTTANHFLKLIHLSEDCQALVVPGDDPENDERCRSIERGAKLVTAMPTNMSVVLQMPRGNLETIFPRAMVLARIRKLIEDMDYGRAFTHCRTQKVDMNILYDYQPTQFLANVDQVLAQLKDVAYIDLFISSLRDEDVTQTMYRDTREGAQTDTLAQAVPDAATPLSQASKVNTVCDAVLRSLQAQKNANLQNIITAHVCKSPPALDDGLLVVAGLIQEDEKLAERAVEHICFLVDVNNLYDHALGLYNLDLALLVAQQSQRDPREYLPFVQDLHRMSDLRRRFAIDDHLAHREKALSHLKALEVFDEVESYTVKHNLYKAALGLYRYDEPRRASLTSLYASHLESTSKFREAGLAYESLGNYVRATACYRTAGATCWQECLFVAQQQTPALSPGAFADLAMALAEALSEAKDYAAAATVHLDYLGSVENAIRCLCKGANFADAFRLIARHNRSDLLESTLDSGLTEALSTNTEFLADCKAQLKAQVPRIAELRRRAIEDPLAFYEGERPWGHSAGDMPDDVSIAASSRLSTGASLFTRYTNKDGSVGTIGSNVSRATSKRRAREEKKRARGRKGTVYEEEYLVSSVRRLVDRVESTKTEVEKLVFALARRGMLERSRAIEALMAEVVDSCRAAVAEVWRASQSAVPQTDGASGGPDGAGVSEDHHRVVGGEAVFQESVEAKNVRQEPPLIKDFARLSLLG